MTTRQLRFTAPTSLAIVEGATTPDPGQPGVVVWSTTANKNLTWDGTTWAGPATGSGPTTGQAYAISRGWALQ